MKSHEANNHLSDLGEMFEVLREYQMKPNPQKCNFGVYSGKFLGYIVSEKGIEANPEQVQAIRNIVEPKTIMDVMSLNGKDAASSRFISRSTDKCVTFFDVIKKKKKFEWDE